MTASEPIPPFDPTTTFVHLDGGRAEVMPVDEHFWPAVMSGQRPLPGWLVTASSWTAGPGVAAGSHSEVHPAGDEVHLCMAGAMTAILEGDGGEQRVDFDPGQVCVVPAGVWHRLEARQDSRVLSLTFGERSEHRPAPGS
ncbi:MAG: cupin domain-containing protein [Actinomycetota bacterium]|nr:cupin domain-containing protein [Actinomycetota bacterium]